MISVQLVVNKLLCGSSQQFACISKGQVEFTLTFTPHYAMQSLKYI